MTAPGSLRREDRREPAPGLLPVLPCSFDLAPRAAMRLQEDLRRGIRVEPLPARRIARVAGCDVAVAGDRLCASILVFSLPELQLLDAADAEVEAAFPYVPGLLSFREIPALLAACARLRVRPDAIMCDGQGRAHPRRFGLACHLGLLLDMPTVGCAKSRLIGEHREPGARRGDRVPLHDGREVIGTVLRTRDGVRPLYISVGHRARLRDAVDLVLRCGAGYRLPEPTRRADQRVGRRAKELRSLGARFSAR